MGGRLRLHPELSRARFLPPLPIGPRTIGLFRRAPRPAPAPVDIEVIDQAVAGGSANSQVRLRWYREKAGRPAREAVLLWFHGGGYVLGDPLQDESTCLWFVRELGITVVSASYRLAPEHPAPAAIEDAYAALTAVTAQSTVRGISPERIAVGGASAGGGLAAALTLYAHDRGGPAIAFQLLNYPMLDDRTATLPLRTTPYTRMWSPKSNRWAWSVNLDVEPGGGGVSEYAAPARRTDLTGLPPAWIGVGTLDLFHDEDVAYARRLREAGVDCELTVLDGAFHGFDVPFAKTDLVRRYRDTQAAALRRGLGIQP